MLPYLAWLAFANLLNISILRKNDAGVRFLPALPAGA